MKIKEKYHIPVIILLWIVTIIIINPLREFPLNDDWVYTLSVLKLLGQGELFIDPWVAVTLASHILWGSLFAGIFGFSFSVLRISSLVMSLAGVLVGYKILGDLFKSRRQAFLLSLFIAFNPIFLNLSFTYMTDLTFYGLVIFSSYFYILSFRKEDTYSIYFATLFAAFAALTRQVGLFVPLSALLTVAILQRGIFNRKVLTYFLLTLLVAIIMFGYIFWLKSSGGKPESFRDVDQFVGSENLIAVLLLRMLDHTGRWLAETGLWFLPLVTFFTFRSWKSCKRYLLPAGLITLALGVTVVLQTSHFPGGNIFYVLGLGPRTLADVYLFGIAENGGLSDALTILLRGLALVGGFMLAWLMVAGTFDVFSRLRKAPDLLSKTKLFSIILILIYQAVFLGSFTYFDRYGIIIFIPVLILIYPAGLIGKKTTRTASTIMVAFILLIAVFSVLATRDYLSWNQVRWDTANELVEEGIKPQEIDGGHEYNGWHGTNFDKYGRWDPGKFDYILAFNPLDGYEVAYQKPFTRLVTCSEEYIYVLQKVPAVDDPDNTAISPN